MGNSPTEEDINNIDALEIPIGFRFSPTDLELVNYYLLPKILGEPLPASVILDIDETELYSKPPNKLEMNFCERKECFFFTHGDGYSHDELRSIRMVGNGKGFWKSDGEETFICNCYGDNKFAFKICWTYYNGTPKKGKKTKWVMSEYRLQMEDDNLTDEKEWILGRIEYVCHYKNPFE
ncbi:NAC domain-containing protein 83-like [Telopea speciosissima]|uniref:NAC domain-containing protein 83-like n=1 Tax=Telopea speciosissima TaxID=54955 RepID=UPI001CC4DB01|nr:NAC domain-containing protein 83-like [Telopea speciosissima]